jgi:hypothetical protein
VTRDNAELLALSGPRNPYPGRLGVAEEGALADLLLVAGDPTGNIKLIEDPAKKLFGHHEGRAHLPEPHQMKTKRLLAALCGLS